MALPTPPVAVLSPFDSSEASSALSRARLTGTGGWRDDPGSSVGPLPAWLDPRDGRRRVAKPNAESRQRHASSRPRTEKGVFMTRAQLDAEGYARDPATGLWSKRDPAARVDTTTRPS